MEEIINKISVDNRSSKYVENAHPILLINGEPLDHVLNEYYPDDFLLGLIPPIIDWMNVDEEAKLVEQIYDSADELKILPILMCPDDCDLSCTIIVAEIEMTSDLMKWNRIGIDQGNPKEWIEKGRFLEAGIEWLDQVPVMTFKREDYKSLEKVYKNKT